MRRWLLVAFLLTAVPAYGAIELEFTQITRTDSQLSSNQRLIAKALIDGNRSRVDYLEGSTRGAGQYVISTNGAQDLVIVDTKTETYATKHPSDTSRSFQTLGIEISNLSVDFAELGPGPSIAGYPTKGFRVTASYQITLNVGSIPLKQNVNTVIEKWTTNSFGDISPTLLGGASHDTGDPDMDKLINAETTRIPGFPLKQEIRVTSHLVDRGVDPSKATRNRVTQLLVTKISSTTANDSQFSVPKHFLESSEANAIRQDNGVHILSMSEDPEN